VLLWLLVAEYVPTRYWYTCTQSKNMRPRFSNGKLKRLNNKSMMFS
jgi:hypothetical protein